VQELWPEPAGATWNEATENRERSGGVSVMWPIDLTRSCRPPHNHPNSGLSVSRRNHPSATRSLPYITAWYNCGTAQRTGLHHVRPGYRGHSGCHRFSL